MDANLLSSGLHPSRSLIRCSFEDGFPPFDPVDGGSGTEATLKIASVDIEKLVY